MYTLIYNKDERIARPVAIKKTLHINCYVNIIRIIL